MTRHCLFEMMDWLSFRNDDDCRFEMTIAFSSKWWIDCRFEMIDDFLFERSMAFSSIWRWCSLREMGLDALCYFRNDSHLSCHRRKMLCPVVFTFERIDYFEERPDIFGNDSWFRNESSRQKLSKSYHLVKIGNLVKIFALTSFFKGKSYVFWENNRLSALSPCKWYVSCSICKWYRIFIND